MSELSTAEKVAGLIDISDFVKIDIRVGTVISARRNERARKPAYILDIDFGELGRKVSSAQIVDHYSAEELVGRKVTAVVNFPPKSVAGVLSEVLVLAAVCPAHGTVLLRPDREVGDGMRVL